MAKPYEMYTGSILRISDEKTLQLLDLYKKEECLWNTLSPDYKRSYKRMEAADRIAAALNIPNFTGKYVMTKFKNLRNSYCQELKKKARDPYFYTPRVFWFAKMDSFIKPHLQPPRSSLLREQQFEVEIESQTLNTSEFEGSQNETEWEAVIENEISVKKEPVTPERESAAETQESTSLMSEPESAAGSEQGKKRRASRLSEESDFELLSTKIRKSNPKVKKPQSTNDISQLLSVLEDITIQMSRTTSTSKDDHFDSFGKYVASMLRAMPVRKAMSIQPEIVKLIVAGIGTNEEIVSQSDN